MCRLVYRRSLLAGAVAAIVAWPARGPRASEAAAWDALRAGAVVLFRHAHAPGVGDPVDMTLDDCATQRNLDLRGRDQARRIGEAIRARGVTVGAVLTSQWCRTTETADLAFPERSRAEPAFNSYFADHSTSLQQTDAALRIILAWRGPGALFVSTHQVNITALTGIVPAAGEGTVVQSAGGSLVIVGRIRP